MKTMILVDSCCDLPKDYILDNKAYIDVIGIPIDIGDLSYFDDLGQTFDHEGLYGNLREGMKPSTSQINSFRFFEKYKRLINNGFDIIYIGLSNKMSGTNRNAFKAIDLIKKEFPEACVKALESTSVSLGQGLLALKAVELVKEGEDIESIYRWLVEYQDCVQHWFLVDDLHHLKNGGRISTGEAVIGTFLNVKPILIVDDHGNLKSFIKVKGRKKAYKFLMNQFNLLYNPEIFDQIIIGHGDSLKEANQLEAEIKAAMPNIKIMVTKLSATIASHVGPGMLALGFMGSSRKKHN